MCIKLHTCRIANKVKYKTRKMCFYFNYARTQTFILMKSPKHILTAKEKKIYEKPKKFKILVFFFDIRNFKTLVKVF